MYYTPDVFNTRSDKVSSMLNVDDSSRVGIHDILHGLYHKTRCMRDEATSGVEARQTTQLPSLRTGRQELISQKQHTSRGIVHMEAALVEPVICI